MQKHHWIVLFIVFSILAALAVAWGGFLQFKNPANIKKGGKIAVLCTTGLIADAVRAIGGDRVEVRALMGPGVDPHLYRARESDIHALIAADMVLYNGLHLEGKMGELLAKMKNVTHVVAVADCLVTSELRESEFAGMYDPHVWHDVSLWRKIVKFIGGHLVQYAPQDADYFLNRTTEYLAQLDALDAWIKKEIQTISPEQRILVTAHDAFGYFGRAYGIQVIGLQGMSTDAEISTGDIQELVHFLVSHKVPVIFIESSVAPRAIQAVQHACAYRGWPVVIGQELFSDSLSDQHGPAATYHDLMSYNVRAIIEGLAQ